MSYRSRLMLVALLVTLLGNLAGCSGATDPHAAEWRAYNDYWSARNCC
jgi:hypothetical protein